MTIADTLSAGVSPRRDALGRALTSTRRLNRGNATAEVLAHDFGLLGLLLWDELQQRFGSAHQWRDRLRLLNEARNGLAHADQQKLDRVAGAGWPLTLQSARRWRGTLDALATGIDRVTGDHLRRVFGIPDW